MPSPSWLLLAATLWPGLVTSFAVPPPPIFNGSSSGAGLGKRSTPVSLGWVKRFAAIGDSFTAGIGSGKPMTSDSRYDNRACSRFDYGWPSIVSQNLPELNYMDYPACSGARSTDVWEQARNLASNLDVVMLTAGGNDLCLAAMIRKCIILPYGGEAGCNALIDAAENNLATILKPNIRSILNELKPKMRSDKKGIVVYLGYAPFFDTRNEDCATKQHWHIFEFMRWTFWGQSPLRLTRARREKLNGLVVKINKAISEVVDEFAALPESSRAFDIIYGSWEDWPKESDGQFCSPSGDGDYPEPNQPDLLFFKWPTNEPAPRMDLRRRSLEADPDTKLAEPAAEQNMAVVATSNTTDAVTAEGSLDGIHDTQYESSLHGMNTPNPAAVAHRKLNKRLLLPECPGDNDFDVTLGLGLPDTFGKIFHPNEKGHEAMASFAMYALGVAKHMQDNPEDSSLCSYEDRDFYCVRQRYKLKTWDYNFVSWKTLNDNKDDVCDMAANSNALNSSSGEGSFYHEINRGTPEWVEWHITKVNNLHSFSRSHCVDALRRLQDHCDGDATENPLNFKYGGTILTNGFRYEIKPIWRRKMFKQVDARCRARYVGGYTSYSIWGKGWLGDDHGVALRERAKGCIGPGGLWRWEFEYLDPFDDSEDSYGYEWKAYFRAFIGANDRCFADNHVQKKAGGRSHVAKRNPADERFNDEGCSGGASGDRDGDW
ncbi:SGNH hydrolase-type esterase domain-containing protein [Podospora aff. communis PSN243]|uniref:SGNH hydrolase-type esterase domain-containing protein n=1 Tax=Podospora aff. communis PSN243 TaxID=3040156 RepID=A0AAV9G428_9PEZI|nr:SGNH hydrolase-type esterase domain-containing protein [Podospora aff. communis PSN243]